jgi:hypothetical protein
MTCWTFSHFSRRMWNFTKLFIAEKLLKNDWGAMRGKRECRFLPITRFLSLNAIKQLICYMGAFNAHNAFLGIAVT